MKAHVSIADCTDPHVTLKGIKARICERLKWMDELISLIDCFADIPIGSVQRILAFTWYRVAQLRVATGTMTVWPLVQVKQEKWKLNWVEIRDLRAEAMKTASVPMVEILMKVEEQAVISRTLYMPEAMRHMILSAPVPNIPMAVRMRTNQLAFPVPVLLLPSASAGPKVSLDEFGNPSLSIQEMHQQIGEVLECLLDIPVKALASIANVSHHSITRIRKDTRPGERWPYEQIRSKRYTVSMDDVGSLRAETLAELDPSSFKGRLLKAASDWVATRSVVAGILKTSSSDWSHQAEPKHEDAEWDGLLAYDEVVPEEEEEGEDGYWTNGKDMFSSENESEYWQSVEESLKDS